MANLEPVLLAGTTVRRATLHNAEQMALLDIRPGDMAVSYTHLDVYKRQGEHLRNGREADDRLAELLALLGVFQRLAVGGFCLLYTSRCV